MQTFIIMINSETNEILSDPEESTEYEMGELNKELKIKKSLNRYVKCDEEGNVSPKSLEQIKFHQELNDKYKLKVDNGIKNIMSKPSVSDENLLYFVVIYYHNKSADVIDMKECNSSEDAIEVVEDIIKNYKGDLKKDFCIIKGKKLSIKTKVIIEE